MGTGLSLKAHQSKIMDNRVFNINGSTREMLEKVLELAFLQSGYKVCEGFIVSPEKGLILLWSNSPKECNKFPSPLPPLDTAAIVWQWLQSEEASKTKVTGWDARCDHDGDNGDGWRVYCEDWGHVAGMWEAIVAVTPAVMWYGK